MDSLSKKAFEYPQAIIDVYNWLNKYHSELNYSFQDVSNVLLSSYSKETLSKQSIEKLDKLLLLANKKEIYLLKIQKVRTVAQKMKMKF